MNLLIIFISFCRRWHSLGTYFLALSTVVFWTGCATRKQVSRRTPSVSTPLVTAPRTLTDSPSFVFNTNKLAELDAAIEAAIAERRLPGGVVWLERKGAIYSRAYGNRSLWPDTNTTRLDTIYDLASLTKVLATAPAIMMLSESGSLDLDAPVWKYMPEFQGQEREKVTVRHLLTHTSGLRPGIPRSDSWTGREEAMRRALNEVPNPSPGTLFRYSDINFILLGELVRRISGKELNHFCEDRIFKPLKMVDTSYNPKADPRIAPTERSGNSVFLGTVHDPTAQRMGGVAGHAGLFGTAQDVARFARMMLNKGSLDGVRILRESTVDVMIAVQGPATLPQKRGFGWDIDTPYSGPRGNLFPIGSYGHTGWTGTSIWIDPKSETFIVFLSNRNHPTEEGNVLALRRKLGTLAAESLVGFEFSRPGADSGK